jgi:hypothetical protein
MLNCVNEWCNKWSLSIICSKSNILYFRPSSIERSTFSFNCGDYNISYVDSYKYLGIWFSEHVTWDKADRELSKSASRALECLTTRFYACGGMNYKVFTKLYNLFYCMALLYGDLHVERSIELGLKCKIYDLLQSIVNLHLLGTDHLT